MCFSIWFFFLHHSSFFVGYILPSSFISLVLLFISKKEKIILSLSLSLSLVHFYCHSRVTRRSLQYTQLTYRVNIVVAVTLIQLLRFVQRCTYMCLTSGKTTVYSRDVVKGSREDSHYSQTVLRDLRFAFKQQIPLVAFNRSDPAGLWYVSNANDLFNGCQFVLSIDASSMRNFTYNEIANVIILEHIAYRYLWIFFDIFRCYIVCYVGIRMLPTGTHNMCYTIYFGISLTLQLWELTDTVTFVKFKIDSRNLSYWNV